MKVFKFFVGEFFYACAAKTIEEAYSILCESIGKVEVDSVQGIPESKWDEKSIKIHECNDFDTETYFISIREAIVGDDPQLIFTNDLNSF